MLMRIDRWNQDEAARHAYGSHQFKLRILDVVVAGLSFVVLSPLLALIALAIAIESGLPILFSQTRLGLNGRPFQLYKFRKFYRDVGTDGSPLTSAGDPRMTPLGRFLARTKFDELPQFWNVLKGDMSMVGPRPESLAFADCFAGGYERVLDFKPGIFGPSQVAGRHECTRYPVNSDPARFYRDVLFREKAETDLAYFPGRTLMSDFVWLLRGVLAVIGLNVAAAQAHTECL
ncbi:MAG: sugar transferase [Hyphomicrobium sp.]